MAMLNGDTGRSSAAAYDPLVPWLQKIKKSLDDLCSENDSGADLDKLLSDCVSIFKPDHRYRNDIRFLKIWFLYLDGSKDFEWVYRQIEESQICVGHSLLYEWYALFLEAKGLWQRANSIYQAGISRKAEPLERLKTAYLLFVQRITEKANKIDENKAFECETNSVNPWASSIMKDLTQKINSQLVKYDGYHASNKVYSGKVSLSSLQNSSRNKILEIGGKKYQIKGCAGQGGFAQVFKAYVNSNPDDVVALKIQTPPFSWEFYMYRQLDYRIPGKQRSSFGSSYGMHLYSDYSILVCDYLSHGTLQDVINSYVVIGKFMEEVLCMYYTKEMLWMLETLHSVGVIHGDFKPDNMLIRYSLYDELTEEGFRERTGPWSHQGLCLVDWGRGIDLRLFPDNTEFRGDCQTSGFCCTEMKENKAWKFQVDTYGLCVIVHMMLHNNYMEVEKKASPDGGYIYLPKLSFKRYWNAELWKNLFTKLLNSESCGNDTATLKNLRESFQDCICSSPQLLKKLKELLAKQRISLCCS